MNTSLQISLIFVNYKSAQLLDSALQSLNSFEQEPDLFEVIVVNNDANESAALQKLRQRSPFLLIESGGNIGFGRANNLGAKQSHGKILAFINPDVLWCGAYLRQIVQLFDQQKTIGVLGMALIGTAHQPELWSAGEAPRLSTLFANNIFPRRASLWKETGLSYPDWVSGGALCIRASAFATIGGFDDTMFLYFEDVDLCKRVRNQGLSVAHHTDFPIIHFGGKSQSSALLQKKYFYASQKQYFNKHRPKWENYILNCLQFFFCKNR